MFISLTLFGCVAFKTQRPFAEGLRPHRALFAVIKSCAQISFYLPFLYPVSKGVTTVFNITIYSSKHKYATSLTRWIAVTHALKNEAQHSPTPSPRLYRNDTHQKLKTLFLLQVFHSTYTLFKTICVKFNLYLDL